MKTPKTELHKMTNSIIFKSGLIMTLISIFIIIASWYWNDYTIKNQTIVGANIGAGIFGLLGIVLCIIGVGLLFAGILIHIAKHIKR